MKELSQEVKDERQEIAQALLRLHIDTIRRTYVFVDAATIVAVPLGGLVWADKLRLGPDVLVFEDPRLNNDPIIIKYYAAVNAIHGPMHIIFVTGTTDLPPGGFKVGPLAFICGGGCKSLRLAGSSHRIWSTTQRAGRCLLPF